MLSWHVRRKMFDSFMQAAHVTPETTVLDIGVTSDARKDSNFFEQLYPYPQNITAVGKEDASFLERHYPGLTFVRADGSTLPFRDESFDLVVSFAVIEHVGSRADQDAFVSELCRVGRSCFIATPNRWYPIEFHTAFPFLHWLPSHWFRAILTRFGQEFWAREDNLNLLSEKELLALFPTNTKAYKKHIRLFGLVSNLMFYLTR